MRTATHRRHIPSLSDNRRQRRLAYIKPALLAVRHNHPERNQEIQWNPDAVLIGGLHPGTVHDRHSLLVDTSCS